MRERPTLGTPFGTDGPWLAAILDVLGDLHDLLDERLARPEPVTEPAPDGRPPAAVPVSEPAPDRPPAEAVPVAEPDPDDEPDVDEELPDPPNRAGRGSALKDWLAFAELAHVPVPADATRADVIAACEQAGAIPAE